MSVTILLNAHLPNRLCGRRIIGLQALREIVVDPRVFLLQRNRQSQDFSLAETLKTSHDSLHFTPNCFVFAQQLRTRPVD